MVNCKRKLSTTIKFILYYYQISWYFPFIIKMFALNLLKISPSMQQHLNIEFLFFILLYGISGLHLRGEGLKSLTNMLGNPSTKLYSHAILELWAHGGNHCTTVPSKAWEMDGIVAFAILKAIIMTLCSLIVITNLVISFMLSHINLKSSSTSIIQKWYSDLLHNKRMTSVLTQAKLFQTFLF